MIIKDGNKAVSDVAYMFSDLCAIYPITPSSPMASNVNDLASSNLKNAFDSTVKIIEMQSEAGAAGCMHGALLGGALATTFTSSQGLLLMIPNMYKIAGEMLPAVIHVASRSLATHALSIFGDHQDIYATRQTGFCMLASSSVEDASLMASIAHLSAIKGSLPFLNFFDGFRTSHEVNTLDDIDMSKIVDLLDKTKVKEFRNKMLTGDRKIQKGMAENEDIYFQSMEARNLAYDEIPHIVNDYMQKINDLTNNNFQPFNYYGSKTAKNVIIAMGSVCDTIRLVVDDMNKNNQEVGMIEVHLYRPFSKDYLINVIPKTVQNIAVLDRTKEAGSIYEPLCLDVMASLKDTNINIVGGRYGISSKNTTPAMIKSIYEMLEDEIRDHFVIGIDDDVTNLSLKQPNYFLDLNADEMIVYGYGSDGMVSACKELLKIVNQEKGKYIQGYFEYDSKKSGGVTKSHLRISDNKIKAPYYVENPKCIIITKKEYLDTFDTISNIKDNGLVLLNIEESENLNDLLPNNFKEVIINKNVQLLTVDANKIADKYYLNGKISKIMEVILLELLGIKNAKDILIQHIKKQFATKGQDIIDSNIKALNDALLSVKIIKDKFTYREEINDNDKSIYEMIVSRCGNELKVSELLEYKDGTFPCNFKEYNNIKNTNKIPKWIKENCIECNMCSFVCPHGVIRPFKVDKGGIPLLGDKLKQFLIFSS